MSSSISHACARIGGILTVVLLLCGGVAPARAVAADDEVARLRALRAERRASVRVRSQAATKSAARASFGLLIIPVDFSDARLPADWSSAAVASRVFADTGESLVNYFAVASQGRLVLRPAVAEPVHLPGTRRDYSDRDLNGFTRTRLLATEAIGAVAAAGFPLASLDLDGADGLPSSGDDDGFVDGVLILHAGIGQENDPQDGLVQALQFFLDEPVIARGTGAAFYAVASLASGPGIWAHETAHLLGLEDRYDPLLRPAGGSEVRSRGGLGRFSLMGSGAWGTGGGYGAALPDAYSLSLLGWCDVRRVSASPAAGDTLHPVAAGGAAHRIWTPGEDGHEFFLLETRDPALTLPFDAGLPARQLMITHIDESLAEGEWAEDGFLEWHLRARLIEADADDALRAGDDDGRAEDLFPGPLAQTAFGPFTTPSSFGYAGPSGVQLVDIASTAHGVTYRAVADAQLSVVLGFAGLPPAELLLEARETGGPLTDLEVSVTILAGADWGDFGAGALTATASMVAAAPGRWRTATPISWEPAPTVPPEACTTFRCTFTQQGTTVTTVDRIWCWGVDGAVLDFASAWPGAWSITHPSGDVGTTWHRWVGPPWLTADASPVLICTGAEAADSAAWPAVNYTNGGHAVLTSGPVGAGVTGVRLLHAIDAEMLTANIGLDGGLVSWVAPDGSEVPAEPLGGWPGRIFSQARQALHGRQAFVGDDMVLDPVGVPLWRLDVVPTPTDVGPGPWRLRLSFAADTLWRRRGWVVARIEALTTDPSAAAADLVWEEDLIWGWPFGGEQVTLWRRDEPDGPWQAVATREQTLPQMSQVWPATSIMPLLPGGLTQRHELRLTGPSVVGPAAGPVVVSGVAAGVATTVLRGPWPNPAPAEVRFSLRVAAGATGRLRVYDVRGRLVHSRDYPAGDWLSSWDGCDAHGRRLPSGSYYLRLDGTGPTVTRKVVLLH